MFKDDFCEQFSHNSNVFISKMQLNNAQIKPDNEQSNSKVFFARCFPNDLKNSDESYSFYYIGSKDSFLNPFLLYFNKNKFYHFNSMGTMKKLEKNQSLTEMISFSKTNRELMKRYYLIEKARDSKIFGILIGTMSVAKCA